MECLDVSGYSKQQVTATLFVFTLVTPRGTTVQVGQHPNDTETHASLFKCHLTELTDRQMTSDLTVGLFTHSSLLQPVSVCTGVSCVL